MPTGRSTNKTDPRIVAMAGTTAGGVGIGNASGARMAKYDPFFSGEDHCCRYGPALYWDRSPSREESSPHLTSGALSLG